MTIDDHEALRRLVAAYARAVDRREFAALAALFTEDGLLAIHDPDPRSADGASDTPVRERRGRDEIEKVIIASLARYDVTSHVLGQHTADVDGDRATGETYCMAHHLTTTDGGRHDHVLAIRYLDRFRKIDGVWLFEARRVVVDWTDERELPAAP
jgi:ketosteroid isomerase-like protein